MRSAHIQTNLPAKKIALLHVARRQLGLSEDEYRAILLGRGGCESSADLDDIGFELVIEYMTALGFRSTWTKRTYGNRPGMATPPQVDTIRRLWQEWSGADDEMALNRWLERSYHIAAVRFLPPETASKAITGLKAMCRRKAQQPDSAVGGG